MEHHKFNDKYYKYMSKMKLPDIEYT